MYCQSCGAKNSDEAKFCNQCGSRIAAAGEAGGPLAGDAASTQRSPAPAAMSRPNAYHPDTGFGGPSMMSVSLASIGVQSTKKVWLGIALLAAALVGLGWLGAWLARGEPDVVVEAGHAEPDDPFVIGAPLPEGAAEPEVDIVSGSEGGLGAPPSGGSSSGGSMAGASMGAASPGPHGSSQGSEPSARPPRMSANSTVSMRSSSSSAHRERGSMAEASSGGGAGGSAEPTSMGSGGSSSGGVASGGVASGGVASGGMASGGTSSTTPPTDAPEERDLELDLYSSRVRYVIRRYYANRAQACFDRATRNAPTVSGTVVVSMTIGADGSISRARTTRNTTGDENLGQCLQAQVSTWRLPPPPGGSLDMQMPFSR